MKTTPKTEPNISFTAILRDCPHNKTAEGGNRIFDFEVFIDGEKRAELHRWSQRRRGYVLQSLNGEMLKDGTFLRLESASQSKFREDIMAWLRAGYIPTVAESKRRAKEIEDEKQAEIQRAIEAERKARVAAVADELFDFVKTYLDETDCGNALIIGRGIGAEHGEEMSHGRCFHCTARRLVTQVTQPRGTA